MAMRRIAMSGVQGLARQQGAVVPKVAARAAATSSNNRPLSPHLQIYKFEINAQASVLHRGTGIVLSLGYGLVPMLTLFGAEIGPIVECVATTPLIAQVAKFGIAYSFLQHWAGGLRHLVWDEAKGQAIKDVDRTGYAAVGLAAVGAAGLTLASWTESPVAAAF